MDQVLINQLQFYTPPELIKKILTNDKQCLAVARYVIDRGFKHKPQLWKTIALPEYEDFFQAAVSGFNPYKEMNKGLLHAIETYNPYKKQVEVDGISLIQTIEGIEQATCPLCGKRGETVSLWPHSAGNETVSAENAPDPVFHKNNKYCGKQIENATEEELALWLEQDLIRKSGKRYFCNYKSRLASLKNHISKQIGFLVQDIRSQEYHPSRSLKKHPFYPCPQSECNTLVPDFNTSTTNKTEQLECPECGNIFDLKEFREDKNRKATIVYQARGATNTLSFSDHSSETDGRSTYEEIIGNYTVTSRIDDPAVHYNIVQQEKAELFGKLISRIRELAASSLSKKQYERLMSDPDVEKIDGVPETQNFKIFYEHFFIDDLSQKMTHRGKAKDSGDESSTYRHLALKYLNKEQHYTKCLDCNHKMYEPTESAKFKKAGTRQECEVCSSTNVAYHGPKCGRPGSQNPNCKEHGDVEIVMYIFQTIEPKIRRLEELVKNDKKAQDIYDRIQELIIAKEEMEANQDMAKLLNY